MRPLILALLATACATPAVASESGVPEVAIAPMPVVEVAPMPVVYGPPAPVSFVDAEGPAVEQPEAPAPRIETDDRSLIEKIGPRKLAAFTVVNALDKWSTRRCIHKRTCEEAGWGVNALFGKRPSDIELVGAFAIDEALYLGGSVIFGEAFGYQSGAIRGFQIGMIGTRGVIGTMNLRF